MAVAAGTHEGPRTRSFALLGDERLARLAAAGHERAFTVVYQRYHQPLYRYCRSILRDDADAQDALQSTFAAAFAALARGQRDAPIRPWLFRIAHNEAISVVRRRRPTTDLSAAAGAWTASTEDQVAERAELKTLLHDLDRLTERQRSALVMRELSGLSHEEIASSLGTSVGTAKQTIYEARRSMFEFAEGRAMPCDEIRRTISDADGRALRGRRVRAHLRECSACAEFAAAIPARSADLRALAPTMPAAAAAGLLHHVLGAGSGHATGGLTGLATAAAGKTAGAALTTNALAGFAVVAGATVGVTVGVGSLVHAHHPVHRVVPAVSPIVPAAPAQPAGASSSPGVGLAVRSGHAAHAARTAGRSASATALPGQPRSVGVGRTPSRATSRAGTSTTTAPGSRAGAGSGSTTATAPGNSANAPGHSATGTGNSPNAPGHIESATGPGSSTSAPGHSATGPGNSANAPRHNKSDTTGRATNPGNSANAPAPADAPTTTAPTTMPLSVTTASTTTPAPATPATSVAPAAGAPAPIDPSTKKHSK
jgi:RNA polymerase sigma factor (sigma-70 family)